MPQHVLTKVPTVQRGRFVADHRTWVTEPPGSACHAMAALRGLPGARLIEYRGD